jgi:hypothetical protein
LVRDDPYTVRYPAPAPGEQSAEVLREGGFSADEVAQRVADGVVQLP